MGKRASVKVRFDGALCARGAMLSSWASLELPKQFDVLDVNKSTIYAYTKTHSTNDKHVIPPFHFLF